MLMWSDFPSSLTLTFFPAELLWPIGNFWVLLSLTTTCWWNLLSNKTDLSSLYPPGLWLWVDCLERCSDCQSRIFVITCNAKFLHIVTCRGMFPFACVDVHLNTFKILWFCLLVKKKYILFELFISVNSQSSEKFPLSTILSRTRVSDSKWPPAVNVIVKSFPL